MIRETITFPSGDGVTTIHGAIWKPDRGEPSAVIQIAHGMVEFIDRYEEFAEYLTEHGFAAAGHDHLGHGDSVTSRERWGYFADERGGGCLLKDMHSLRKLVQNRYPSVPYFMLGHSMGSFLLRAYLAGHGEGLAGAVLTGTGYIPSAVVRAGLRITKTMAGRYGWNHRSKMVEMLFFSRAISRFDMTGKDPGKSWLTKDAKLAEAYYADERRGFTFSLNAYHSFLRAMLYGNRSMDQIPKTLPVILMSGMEDPIGNFGSGVRKTGEKLWHAGVRDVTVKLYPGDRHEILNETDRVQVYEDLVSWCRERMRPPEDGTRSAGAAPSDPPYPPRSKENSAG